MMSMDTLINSIRASFDRDEVKRLLIVGGDTYWFDINATSDIASTGFCYLASEVVYNLTGKSKQWWFKEIIAPDILPHNGKHYYLQNKDTGAILDITSDQFAHTQIPYDRSKNKGIRFRSKNCNQFIKILGINNGTKQQATD